MTGKSKKEIIGIVLCGGESTRMGKDKAFLTYHQKPQLYHVYDLLNTICDQTVLSVNLAQYNLISLGFPAVVDSEPYLNHGPLTGLLSVANKFPGKPLLLVGCDYPYLLSADLKLLADHFELNSQTCGLQNTQTGAIEPLLCIYSPDAVHQLNIELTNGYDSLRTFLTKSTANKVKATGLLSHISIDTPESFIKFRNQL